MLMFVLPDVNGESFVFSQKDSYKRCQWAEMFEEKSVEVFLIMKPQYLR